MKLANGALFGHSCNKSAKYLNKFHKNLSMGSENIYLVYVKVHLEPWVTLHLEPKQTKINKKRYILGVVSQSTVQILNEICPAV
jgi:hypothetical protein